MDSANIDTLGLDPATLIRLAWDQVTRTRVETTVPLGELWEELDLEPGADVRGYLDPDVLGPLLAEHEGEQPRAPARPGERHRENLCAWLLRDPRTVFTVTLIVGEDLHRAAYVLRAPDAQTAAQMAAAHHAEASGLEEHELTVCDEPGHTFPGTPAWPAPIPDAPCRDLRGPIDEQLYRDARRRRAAAGS